MERFIHRQNIEHYERLLQTVTEEAERKRILKLLEEEKKRKPIWTVHQKQNGGHRQFAMPVRAIPSSVLGALQSVAWLPRLSTRREYDGMRTLMRVAIRFCRRPLAQRPGRMAL